MKNYYGCILQIATVIGVAFIYVGSGMIAWRWVNPQTFLEAITFLIAWFIISRILEFVISIIGTVILDIMEKKRNR